MRVKLENGMLKTMYNDKVGNLRAKLFVTKNGMLKTIYNNE